MKLYRKLDKNNKKKKERMAGRILGMQKAIAIICENAIKITLAAKNISSVTYENMPFIILELSNKIKEINGAKLEALSGIFSSDGYEKEFVVDKESSDKFMMLINEWITEELIGEVLSSYSEKEFKSNLLIEGYLNKVNDQTGIQHEVN